MESYEKPCLISQAHVRGIIPLAAVGAAVAGLSAAQLAGVASVAGLGYGMLNANTKGSNDIIPFTYGLALQE
ncbi:hypothetical protein I6E26_09105 [Anaerovibrio lipolyticus]|uniref:hypothetical protein n=1 Tax=Anaerovibrio lipolyticus TaxID=82374 RepID=UPI001F206C04|nr:hypothetical protein [Anaerovibrio lipolyticus]MCF2601695.1 hypothetical protein [Anaerovibrio lipolyticus]